MLVKRLYNNAIIPEFKSKGAAALDLYSIEDITILSGETVIIKTGIAVAIEPTSFGLIRDRSSIAKRGIFVVGGVIDSDYRGEIGVMLHNSANSFENCPFYISSGDRIAQMIILPYAKPEIIEVDELPESERGTGGYGSTGK